MVIWLNIKHVFVLGVISSGSRYRIPTYAATLDAKVFRTMMALAAVFDLETHQYDVQNAFPRCHLDEVVCCECPDGYSKPGMSSLLLKALYGLRPSEIVAQEIGS